MDKIAAGFLAAVAAVFVLTGYSEAKKTGSLFSAGAQVADAVAPPPTIPARTSPPTPQVPPQITLKLRNFNDGTNALLTIDFETGYAHVDEYDLHASRRLAPDELRALARELLEADVGRLDGTDVTGPVPAYDATNFELTTTEGGRTATVSGAAGYYAPEYERISPLLHDLESIRRSIIDLAVSPGRTPPPGAPATSPVPKTNDLEGAGPRKGVVDALGGD
jgi:hypothetical protein